MGTASSEGEAVTDGSPPPAASSRVRLSSPATDAGAALVRERLRSHLFGRPCVPVRIGRYAVLERLGAGGFGEVYAAYDDKLDRRVALKVMRTDRRTATEADELLREARTLARLAHPNVVAVFDVSSVEASDGAQEVVIAMELVSGRPLHEWISRNEPSWREILRMYIQAGHGLAAAHRAGVIHRDFKPANVMVGDDGRARVLDFGLARRGTLATPEPTNPESDSDAVLVAHSGDTGYVRGTPLYMSPEQHEGRRVDARTDQYSFCLALWESVFGEGPFPHGDPAGVRTAKRSGPPVLPAEPWLPKRVRRALARGLAPDPDARFLDMEALLRELDVQSRRGVRWSLAIGALLGGGMSAYVAFTAAQTGCDGAEAKLAGVWDDERRQAIERAFLATGSSFGRAAFGNTSSTLDEWTQSWSRSHQAACESHARGEQSAEMLDLRTACLERELQSLHAVTDVLVAADRDVVGRAHRVIDGLPPVAACEDTLSLRQRQPEPADAATRKEIGEIRQVVARSHASEDAARYAEALTLAEEATTRVQAIEYPPLTAEVGHARAAALSSSGDKQAARAGYEAAVFIAQEVGDDRLVAECARGLVWVLGNDLGQFDTAESWAGLAQATLRRIGGDPDIEAMLHNAIGAMRVRQGRYDDAMVEYRAGLELVRAAHGDRDHRVVAYLNNIANAYSERGDYASAQAAYEEAIAFSAETLGTDHPQTLLLRTNHVYVLTRLERYDEARAQATEALQLQERAVGPDHPNVAQALTVLGTVEQGQGDIAAIGHFERALAIHERGAEVDPLALISVLHNLAEAEANARLFDSARAHLDRALAIVDARLPPGHLDRVYVLAELASVARADKRLTEARDLARRSIEEAVAAKASAHYIVGAAGSVLGAALLGLEDPRAAIEALEQASKIVEGAVGREHSEFTWIQALLAEALAADGQAERARATIDATRVAADAGGGLTQVPRGLLFLAEARLRRAEGDPAGARTLAELARDNLDPANAMRADTLLASLP